MELRNKNYIFAKFNNNTIKIKERKMKKLVFLACFMAVSSFMACGNKTESNVSANDSDTILVDSLDSVVVDSLDSVIVSE